MNHKKTCCVCFTSEKIHKFPQGKGPSTAERFATWATFAALENVLDDQKCYALCEKHFERRMFLNNLSSRLVKPAFPTLHPPVYHGPCLMDSTVVEPSIPKSEVFKIIYRWKENLLISSSSPPDSVGRRSSSPVSSTAERPMEKDQYISQPLVNQPLKFINRSSVMNSKMKILLDSSTESMETRPISPVISQSKTKSRKNIQFLKTYSRRNVFSKIKTADNIVPGLVTYSPNTDNDKLTSFEKGILSSNEDERNTTPICSSLLVSLADRPHSPLLETMSAGLVLTPTNSVEGSFIFPAVEAILTDAEMEFSFTNIISTLTSSPENEKDLLSAAISDADISFNKGEQFCIGHKKKKKYDPALVNSVLNEMDYVDNLIMN